MKKKKAIILCFIVVMSSIAIFSMTTTNKTEENNIINDDTETQLTIEFDPKKPKTAAYQTYNELWIDDYSSFPVDIPPPVATLHRR